MGRKKVKPDYDAAKIQAEMIEICRVLCVNDKGDNPTEKKKPKISMRAAANELGISVSKVVKLLITGGYYSSDIQEKIEKLQKEGKSVADIQQILRVSRATVQSYLPYKKGIYNTKEISLNAERIRIYRERARCVSALQKDISEQNLWDAVVAFRGYPFHTSSGLPFKYELKIGRAGTFNRELIVSRRTESKTLAWSSVVLAFKKAIEMQGEVIERPKALGDIRGVSYIYPMLFRFGIIKVPEKNAEKMLLHRIDM